MSKKLITITEGQFNRLVRMCAFEKLNEKRRKKYDSLINEAINQIFEEDEGGDDDEDDGEPIYDSEVGKEETRGENGFIKHHNSDSNYNDSERNQFISCLQNPGLNLNGFWEEYIGSDKMSEELLQKIASGDRTAFDDSCDIISDALARFVSDMTI